MWYYSSKTRGWYNNQIHGAAIPPDAVPVATHEYQRLLAAQSAGLEIVAGPDGVPVAVDPAPPSLDDLAASGRQKRNVLLAGSDWTQVGDAPLATEARAAWATYRQALRDVPEQSGFPADIAWPNAPG